MYLAETLFFLLAAPSSRLEPAHTCRWSKSSTFTVGSQLQRAHLHLAAFLQCPAHRVFLDLQPPILGLGLISCLASSAMTRISSILPSRIPSKSSSGHQTLALCPYPFRGVVPGIGALDGFFFSAEQWRPRTCATTYSSFRF
ncbi:hypothetical protein BJ912DRAFT_1003293, partial [Pholiota molesta]